MLGDKGNEVGSAGGSHFAGDGKGGQIDTSKVGGSTGAVLRQIGGRWSIVDAKTGALRDPHTGLPVGQPKISPAAFVNPTATVIPRTKPAVPASVPIPTVKPALPSSAAVPLDPSIPGRVAAATASKAASVASTMTAKSAREDAIASAAKVAAESMSAGLNHRNPTLGNQDKAVQYGVGTAKESTITPKVDASLPGRAAEAARSEQARISNEIKTQGVPGGGGVVAFEAGPAKSLGAYNPFDAVYQDPQVAGRLAEATRPGAGVPDLPTRGQTVYKTAPDTPQQTPAQAVATQQAINDAIHRVGATRTQFVEPSTTPDVGAALGTLGEPMPAGPEGQAPGVVSTKSSVPIPREKPAVAIGEALRSIAPTEQVPTPRTKPTPPAAPSAEAPVRMDPGIVAQMMKSLAGKLYTDRARPENPIENAAVPGQIGTVLSQNYDQAAAPAERPLTGSPPDRYPSPSYGSGPAQDVDFTPPGNFTAAQPAAAAALHDLVNQMIGVKSRPKESEVGTPAPAASQQSVPVPIPREKPAQRVPVAQSPMFKGVIDQPEQSMAFDVVDDRIPATEPNLMQKAITGLGSVVSNVSPGKLGPGGQGKNNSQGNAGGPSNNSPNPKDWEGKGFTDEEVTHLQTLKGNAYRKELERLLALHKDGVKPSTGVPTNYSTIIAQYIADQKRILAGNGHGLIPI